MALGTRQFTGFLPGVGTFCVGFAFIISATVLNIAHDRMNQNDIDSLPFFLPSLYSVTGKIGVTLMLVTIGLAILIVGAICRHGFRFSTRVETRETTAAAADPFALAGLGSNGRPHTGRVVLDTAKYFGPASALPGTPRWVTDEPKEAEEIPETPKLPAQAWRRAQ